jgi:hypothetical protein
MAISNSPAFIFIRRGRLRSLLALTLLLFGAQHALSWPMSGSGTDPEDLFLVQIDSPEADVLKAVQEVTEDQIIHGTYSYEKERTLYGAHAAPSAQVFSSWRDPGKAFYKVASGVLSPKYFKDSEDIGTISVRYVVQAIDANSTSLRIDAIFVDARRQKHLSKGSVESAEYAAIQQHLKTIQTERKQNEQAARDIAQSRAKSSLQKEAMRESSLDSGDSWALGLTVPQLEQRVAELRRQVELQAKESGATLKSAPNRAAATISTLPGKTEVVVVVLTAYWYGVQTEDGHRGWIHRSQLEPVD